MEIVARLQATLIDLVGRVLDRGLVIKANIVIPVAGASPISINPRAAQAGMETVVKNRVVWDWDQRILAREVESPKISRVLAMAANNGTEPPLRSREPAPH